MQNSGFWHILLFCLLFGFLHSLLALNSVKKLFRDRLGKGAYRFYRLFYVIVALATTGLLAWAVLAFPDQYLYTIQPPWIYLTLLVQLGCIACLLISFLQNHPFEFIGLDPFIKSNQGDEKPRLVSTGFNCWTRHPLYLFSLILIWCFPFMTWNLLALFTGLTVYTLAGSLLEERRLVQDYDEEYRAYQRRTPWLVPNPFRRCR